MAPSRQRAVEEPELTTEQKRHVYSSAILRMYESGIMSHKTAMDSLKRVQNG